jgi:hypothetical protein
MFKRMFKFCCTPPSKDQPELKADRRTEGVNADSVSFFLSGCLVAAQVGSRLLAQEQSRPPTLSSPGWAGMLLLLSSPATRLSETNCPWIFSAMQVVYPRGYVLHSADSTLPGGFEGDAVRRQAREGTLASGIGPF